MVMVYDMSLVVVLALKMAATNSGTIDPMKISRYHGPLRTGACRLARHGRPQSAVKKQCLKVPVEILGGARTSYEALPRVASMAKQMVETVAKANPPLSLLEVGASYLDRDGSYYVALVFTYGPQNN